jgi:hypothetical protein
MEHPSYFDGESRLVEAVAFIEKFLLFLEFMLYGRYEGEGGSCVAPLFSKYFAEFEFAALFSVAASPRLILVSSI